MTDLELPLSMAIEERFARTVVERQFQLAAVEAALEMSTEDVLSMLARPAVQRHLGRLVSTGEAAIPIAPPSEIMERMTGIIRTKWDVYAEKCKAPDYDAYLRTMTSACVAYAAIQKTRFTIPKRKNLSRRQALEMVQAIAVEGRVVS